MICGDAKRIMISLGERSIIKFTRKMVKTKQTLSSNDSDDSDDENLSMYTGPSPSNRRLSCTLAIVTDADSEAQGHQ